MKLKHFDLIACVLAAVILRLSVPSYAGASISEKLFGTTTDNQPVFEYTLANGKGGVAKIITYGAIVTQLWVPDRNGKYADVVLGFDNLKQYENESPYFGAVVGRVGNRIAKGQFTVDDVKYAIPVNNGPNHLHGGVRGYDKRVWHAETAMTADGPTVRLTLTDPDGAEGYPGEVKVSVIYSLTGNNALKIQYYATTTKATPINVTNHSYFNLRDAGKSDILGHVLMVNADRYTPVDDTLIPTGELAKVKGTPIDFTTPTPIGSRIKQMGGDPVGYDHNMCLRNQDGSFAKGIEVYEPTSGRLMEVWTTEPGVQFYSGNFLDGSATGKDGAVYKQYHGFCLETQHYPDSVNHAKFPNAVLRPGQVYRQVTEFRFSAK